MHHIQSHILKILTTRGVVRYTELRPDGVPGNRFSYHLNRLLGDGFIRKNNHGYELTAPGKRYVDKISIVAFIPRFQPKIVTVTLCTNDRGDYLLWRRDREPFVGKLAFPYGKVHFGEKIDDAAKRELEEKTGHTATLSHRGDAYLFLREDGETVSSMLCHVFSGKKPIRKNHHNSSVIWRSSREFKKNELVPGFLELLRLVTRNKRKRFFAEIEA